MYRIPDSFRNENEDYITVPVIKKFIRDNNLDITTDTNQRQELIEEVETYANESPENKEKVLGWLDVVLKEGIKVLDLSYYDLRDQISLDMLTNAYLKSVLSVYALEHSHICSAKHKELGLKKWDISETQLGRSVSLCFTRLVVQSNSQQDAEVKIYPVFVDVFLDRNLIIGRAKSKSGLYDKYNLDDFNIINAATTTTEKIIKQAVKKALSILPICECRDEIKHDSFRRNLFILLDRYSFTPECIKKLLSEKEDVLESTSINLMDTYGIDRNKAISSFKKDMNNMMEKYISIYYGDQSVFTKDREAYPIKLRATDEEQSSVEQRSTLSQPLQTKAVFFDNKKMLQETRTCDTATFSFDRIDKKFFPKNSFDVSFAAKKMGCIVKILQYAREEDIQNVICKLLSTSELNG